MPQSTKGGTSRRRLVPVKVGAAHDVFISYSSLDKPIADGMCATLESEGVRCWIAPRDVLGGMQWDTQVLEAVEAARVVVLILTKNSNVSPQVEKEILTAVNAGTTVIPVRVEDVEPSRFIQFHLGRVHWLDAFTPPLEKHARRLAETVKLLLAEGSEGAKHGPSALPPGTPGTTQEQSTTKGRKRAGRGSTTRRKARSSLAPVWLVGGGVVLAAAAAYVVFQVPGLNPLMPAGAGAVAPIATVDAAVPSLPCSWLEVDPAASSPDDPVIKMKGAALDSALAKRLLEQALRKVGARNSIDVSAVGQLQPAACATIEALIKHRQSPRVYGPWLKVNDNAFQNLVEVQLLKARILPDFSLVSLASDGNAQALIVGSSDFEHLKAMHPKEIIEGPDVLEMHFRGDPGYLGLVVVRGAQPSGMGLTGADAPATVPSSSFAQEFEKEASAKGWSTQIAWVKINPETP